VIFTGFSLDGYSMLQLKQGVDGLTMATPLDTLKTGLTQGLTATEVMTHKVFEGWGGIGWSWVNLGYLLGGLFLLQQKVINWRIPTAVLGALLLAATLGYLATARRLLHRHRSGHQPDQCPGQALVRCRLRGAHLRDPRLRQLPRRGGLRGAHHERRHPPHR